MVSTQAQKSDSSARYASVEEVGRYFGVCKSTVHNWLARKRLTGLRIDGKRLIDWSSVEKLVQQSTDVIQHL